MPRNAPTSCSDFANVCKKTDLIFSTLPTQKCSASKNGTCRFEVCTLPTARTLKVATVSSQSAVMVQYLFGTTPTRKKTQNCDLLSAKIYQNKYGIVDDTNGLASPTSK